MCGSCTTARASCVPSEHLLEKERDCDCAALRHQVAQLEALVSQLDSGRQPLAQAQQTIQDIRPNSSAPEFALDGADIPDRGRLLRPTFASYERHVPKFRNFWSSPWLLWGDETAIHTYPNTTGPGDKPINVYGPELIDTFFARQWPHHPFLHRESFMRRHYEPLAAGHAAESVSVFQVNMVFAIAACDPEASCSRQNLSHHEFFRKAVRYLNRVRSADDIDCIQCLLLLCLYGADEPNAVNMWYTTGLAIRMAIGIDLHRAETIESMDLYHAEMAKRVFWSIYVMDRSMSMTMGRPLGIQDADISTPLPLLLNDAQLREPNAPASPEGNATAQLYDTSAFIHMIKMSQISADIYLTFHAAGSSHMANVVLDTLRSNYHARLNEWLESSPRYFLTLSMVHMADWFRLSFHQGVLSLYRPSRGAPASSFLDIRMCIDSSISVINCYGALYSKNKINHTFVTINSLFMAMVTMLYSLRASATVRAELTRSVAEVNIITGLGLLRGVSCGRAVGERSSVIIERLCQATLAMFDQPVQSDEQIDTEFLSWFGLKCNAASSLNTDGSQRAPVSQTTPDIDTVWNDLFNNGFDAVSATYPGYLGELILDPIAL